MVAASASAVAPAAAQTNESMKILSVGPPRGAVTSLIAKVSAIEAKHGPFHAVFVTGDFFSSQEGLSEEEKSLMAMESDVAMPIPTYISHSTHRPPPELRQLVAEALERQASMGLTPTTPKGDELPLRLAKNLYWLGKDAVHWVSRDDPDNTVFRRTMQSSTDQIVDDEAERRGLRVATCGGQWNKEQWAREVQGVVDGVPGHASADPVQEAAGEGDRAVAATEKGADSYILPSSLDKLYRHVALQPVAAPSQSNGGSSGSGSNAVPVAETLAAARAAASEASKPKTVPLQPPAVDVLLLPSWPAGISLFAKSFPPAGLGEEARTWGLPPLAEVARRARPRYIFAPTPTPTENGPSFDSEQGTNGVFWEREPYSITEGGMTKTTRFISLANFANAKKTRWFVALNMPFEASREAPKGSTASPFGTYQTTTGAQKRKAGTDAQGEEGDGLDSAVNFRWQNKQGGGNKRSKGRDAHRDPGLKDDGPPPAGYICRICGSSEHYVRLCPHKGQQSKSSSSGMAIGANGLPTKPAGAQDALRTLPRRKVEMVGPSDCWFCLSNTACAKHLVVSIGVEAYIALPKGQLPPAEDEACPVPGGGHVLLIPVGHTTSIQAVPDTAARQRLKDEMERQLSALSKFYAAYDCSLVAWSVVKLSNTRAGHMQIQCVPVPEARIVSAAAAAAADGDGNAGRPTTFEQAILESAKNRDYDLQQVPQDRAGPDGHRLVSHEASDEYFELHINSLGSTSGKTFLLDLRQTQTQNQSHGQGNRQPLRFDYQFARTTLAQYLGVPDRADWKACAKGQNVENAETRVVRDGLREFLPDDEDDEDDDDEDDE